MFVELLAEFLFAVFANVVAYYICKKLDRM